MLVRNKMPTFVNDRKSCHAGQTVKTYEKNIGIAWSLAECYNISRKTSRTGI